MNISWLRALFGNAVLASWAQAAIYLVTLGVLIWQVRLQRRALQHAEYLRCQTDFTETYRLLVQSRLHSQVYDSLAEQGKSKFVRWSTYSDADKLIYAYLELLYEIFERVFALHDKKWIPPGEWTQWEAWVDDVVKHPLFRDVHDDNAGMFDPSFETAIAARLPRPAQDQMPGSGGPGKVA